MADIKRLHRNGLEDDGRATAARETAPATYAFWLLSGKSGIGQAVSPPRAASGRRRSNSVLKQLARPELNIVTIEDPIDMVHAEFNQVAGRPAIGLTFGNALRTVLRQGADIIVVGESVTRRPRKGV